MSGDILDLIDNALEDWSASDDAMRWNPDLPASTPVTDGSGYTRGGITWDASSPGTGVSWEPVAPGLSPLEFATVFLDSGDGAWTPIATSSELSFRQEPAACPDGWYVLGRSPERSLTMTFTLSDPAARAAMARMFHFAHEPWCCGPAARCPECNPHGNPPKLPIDGREYARRRAARKRRR